MEFELNEMLFGRSRSISRNHTGLGFALFSGIAILFKLTPTLKHRQWFAYGLFGVMALTALVNAYRNSGVVISFVLATSIPLGAFTLAAVTNQPPANVLLSEFLRALLMGAVFGLPAHLVGAGLRYVVK
ncbi:hypothetical protein [Halorussus sp. MSC15.2]|uniref:hypothetical protein n=1 Tax=Halorussus sp. MSC15.2 TaxID=2283638 RepID=UPI0013D52B9E|nr:hypothetical protein [Halorussus sp. MSC15.2]NEU59001.1 hypothetical protein [Halorussus sp. MSC15.2]